MADHGEQSLADAIIAMAQVFVGSDNINLLVPYGQFGTRSRGGKDHGSPSSLYTMLSPITRFLFRKEDDDLLDYLNEDGVSTEPACYMPIIPTVLVNGSEGTEWSSPIPNYNPRDIIKNVRRRLNGEAIEPMVPWYRGFKGTTERTAGATNSYTVSGIIEEIDKTTLRITELPVRTWTEDYIKFLKSLPIIKGLKNYSDHINVKIEVILSEKNMEIAKKKGLMIIFRLTSSISTSNMLLLDVKGEIQIYDTPEEILEEFFPTRLELYGKRKEFLLKKLEMELSELGNTIKNARKLSAKKDKLLAEVEVLKSSTPKDLWLKDLAALEGKLVERYGQSG